MVETNPVSPAALIVPVEAAGVSVLLARRRGLKTNLAANLAGRAWTAVMAIAFVPLYIRLLGIEAYGLIGFFTALQALTMLLDLGLSSTVNRELARSSALPSRAGEARDLVRTLELLYWALALVITAALVAVAPLIATRWIHPGKLPVDAVLRAVTLMAVVLGAQFPVSFYSGGLLGLERPVLWNLINSVGATLRPIGAVLLLTFVSPSIVLFFAWQVAVSGTQTLVTAFALWRSLPAADERPRFRREILHRVWRFAAGMTGIAVVSLMLTQWDKILLSRLTSLELFGYYTLAWVAASGLYNFVTPIFQTVFPRFSSLVAAGDEAALRSLYHQASQCMSLLIVPAATALIAFAFPIMYAWTGNRSLAAQTAPLVMLLTIGVALNGLMNVPYALQLATGWTRLALELNVTATLVLVPSIIVLVRHFGAIAAAFVWAVLNTFYVTVGVWKMHRRLLRSEMWKWYVADVGKPLLAATVVAAVAIALHRFVVPGRLPQAVFVAGAAIAMVAAAATVLPEARRVFGFMVSEGEESSRP